MNDPANWARIYYLTDDERQSTPGGPAVIDDNGVRHDVPPGVFAAIQHVIEAMRAGRAVQISPLRMELPVDEAADAIGMRSDAFRTHVANGEIPFRSTEYVDWVQLPDVIEWDRKRRESRRAGIEALSDEEPWDDPDGTGA